jgi:hypothetical protein
MVGVGNSADRSKIGENARYADINAGLMFRHTFNDNSEFSVGASGLHLNAAALWTGSPGRATAHPHTGAYAVYRS